MKITVYELEGLIKDGKAPKKIEYNGDIYIFSGDDYSKNDDRKTWLITECHYFLSTFLNQEVEILLEENNEWKDIKEIDHNGKQIYNPKTSSYNTLNSKEKNIFIPVINQLIKNQKYLKERLEEK